MKPMLLMIAILFVAPQILSAQTNCDDLKKENESLKKTLLINSPTKTLTVAKIDFNLIKCEGSVKDQTISLVMTLVNHAANRRILFDQVHAIDLEGNEYTSDKITIGAASENNDLYTDVPIKTIIRLSKVLPDAKILKIVPLKLYDPASGHFEVELRDLPVTWK